MFLKNNIHDIICQEKGDNMKRQIALITGGAKGIGASIVEQLCKNNFDIIKLSFQCLYGVFVCYKDHYSIAKQKTTLTT